ncbi:MAG: phosphoribosyltransferase, partial [Candidatus Heimdallarchaeota archaeon]|nr:phosphoribosyltransferase [Candidatus Heimdallarchaeota archaeon]
KSATLYYKKHSIIKPDYYIKETENWVVYPWEAGETISFLYNKLKDKKSPKEIKSYLKDIGIGSPLVEAYFSLILEQEKRK